MNNGLYIKNEWFNFNNWEMWKKTLINYNINVRFKIVTCVLISYGKCKMQFLNNGFNMLKVDSWRNV